LLLAATAASAKPVAQLPKADDTLAALIPIMAQGVALGPAPKGCSPFEILVARGTGEPGPFGVIVGDFLVPAIAKQVLGSRGYAVQYPASIDMAKSSQKGVDDVINRLNSQSKACPDQKFALVGYSQGAAVMHSALATQGKPSSGGPAERPKLNSDVVPKVLALVMFGDPGFSGTGGMAGLMTAPAFPEVLNSKVRQNCNKQDMVCDPSGGNFAAHLEYNKDPWQKDSVDFIVAAFTGKALPKAPRTPEDAGMKPKGKSTAKAAMVLTT